MILPSASTMRSMSCLGMILTLFTALACTAHAQTTYTINPQASTVTYSMEHPMHKWDGVSHRATGSLVVDEEGTPLTAAISIPVLSFDSGNGNRDSHMAETVESYIFKTVSFESMNIAQDTSRGDTLAWEMAGQLNFHGVSRPITVPVKVVHHDEKFEIMGTFEVTVTEFDMRLPKLLLVPVKDWIGLNFDIVAEASGTSSP